ncbi:protein takeout-like [Thrips palmi]|uniref:Protein takeout-like n=1 Tax=Thrips palmi TaxID=161013 RepID=A0A6P9A527_THRPL|nr:protein takeout-like [Thrips palmi]
MLLRLVLGTAMLGIASLGVASAGKLPPDIKRCVRSDPELSECLRGAVEETLPKLKKGLPKLGLPVLDPLYVQELRITQGGQGPLNMDLTLSDLVTTGLLDNDKVYSASIDLNSMTINASFVFARAVVSSNYTIKGRVLVLPVVGQGESKVVLHECFCVWKIQGKKLTKKDGKDYFEVIGVNLKMTPKKMEMRFDNLFNGDKQLGNTINRVVNENWQLVYNEIGSSFEQAYAEVIKQHTRSLFLHVPIDDFLPVK